MLQKSDLKLLQKQLGNKKVLLDPIDRYAHSGDASMYHMVPQAIVFPATIDDIKTIIAFAHDKKTSLTFRAAGTSLSGQSVTDSLLVNVARYWKKMEILDNAKVVSVESGVIGQMCNDHLHEFSVKIGPDPASINAAMIGGIVANNSSGMCCGVKYNAYNTLDSMLLVLSNGYVLDTKEPDANEKFCRDCPDMANGLLEIRSRIMGNPKIHDRITRKFRYKNTCGYSMNAFVDFEKPSDILQHLLIGSEGTLGFIAEARLKTLPDYPLKATTLAWFANIEDAAHAIPKLAKANCAVIEIMDTKAISSLDDIEIDIPEGVTAQTAMLLVECQSDNKSVVESEINKCKAIFAEYEMLREPSFSFDPKEREESWKMRNGIFPCVGATRKLGTSVLIEDVYFPVERLAEAIIDLQTLFKKYAFNDTCIYGHAKDGSLHFIICPDFNKEEEVKRYSGLMQDITNLVVKKYDGAMKAEHGTGRNIAPFVLLEWGDEIYQLMWDTKRLLDPDNILNPGVVLNENKHVHLENLKKLPQVGYGSDKCIECGFCERVCPSRDYTLTPRMRIAVRRRLKTAEDDSVVNPELEAVKKGFKHSGEDTCAGDGMCSFACPVKIDTGQTMKEFRHENHGVLSNMIASEVEKNFSLVSKGMRTTLKVLEACDSIAEKPLRYGVEKCANIMFALSQHQLPRFPSDFPLPLSAKKMPLTGQINTRHESVLYFPSCLVRMIGDMKGEETKLSVPDAVVQTLETFGYTVIIPSGVKRYCCGQPYMSKGFFETYMTTVEKLVRFLWSASNQGRVPIICETSTCAGIMLSYGKLLKGDILDKWKQLSLFNFSTFMMKNILSTRPKEDWPKLKQLSVLHPTCTMIKSGTVNDFYQLAEYLSDRIYIPKAVGCCGMAGDRGFIFPELTMNATHDECEEVLKLDETVTDVKKVYYSTCRTCEIGMTRATKHYYQNIAYLSWEAFTKN